MRLSLLPILAGSALVAAAPATTTHQPRQAESIDDKLPPIVPVNTRANDDDLIQRLRAAPRAEDRAALLSEPGDYVFDFAPDGSGVTPEGGPADESSGGLSIRADVRSMPALVGLGSSMTVAFLGPCGMNTAHVHPRATELNIVVQGRLVTNFVRENDVTPVANTMDTFQMSVFPQGSIHQEFNPDCTDAVFVASFNDEDPGVSSVGPNLFGLRPEIVEATLGGGPISFNGADVESFRHLIPGNIALGIDACLDRCGISRNSKRDLADLLPKRSQ